MSRKWGKGKYAKAICDRSGFEYPYNEMVVEKGTGLFVHRSETDGMWNLVDHPQNKSPRPKLDGLPLKNARPDSNADWLVFLSDEQGCWLVDGCGNPLFVNSWSV